jgi:hypothetical protein
MLRYYPTYATINNLNTTGGEFILDGKPYSGKYYKTIDGEVYSGASPQVGPNKKLTPVNNYISAPELNNIDLPTNVKKLLANKTDVVSNRIPGKPNFYYPTPNQDDYKKGYIIRYFTKKENQKGNIIEISRDEYNNIVNGTTDYDIRLYQVITILWKITGPLNNKRLSQYNIIPGIIETNQRLTESANKNFLGILEFIAGDYTKFAKPTM